MDKLNPANRLKHVRLMLGLTLKDFGARIGVTGQSVQRWETENAEISEMIARAIEQGLSIRYEWLLTGEGPIWRVSGPAEVEDLEYRPLVPGAATCGPGGEISDPGPGAVRIPFRREFLQQLVHRAGAGSTEDLFCVECAGESMRPTIHPGDVAVINTALDLRMKPKRAALYLVRPDPESTDGRIKRVRVEDGLLWFISEARGFHPISVAVNGVPIQSLVLGRVCWIGRSVLKEDTFEMNW